jgi:hypothetical protein
MAVIDEWHWPIARALLGLPVSRVIGQVYAEFISLIGQLEAVLGINRTQKRRQQRFLDVSTLDRVLRLHTFSVGGTGDTIARE